MLEVLSDVTGLFLRLNISSVLLCWIGVLLFNLFPVLLLYMC